MDVVRLLTPGGVGALAVLDVARGRCGTLVLRRRDGSVRPWPRAGRVLHAVLADGHEPLDDVVVVGRDARVELHLHGGAGVLERVQACVGEGEVGGGGEGRGVAGSLGEGRGTRPSGLRAARALLSARSGPLRHLAEELERALAAGHPLPAGVRRRMHAVLALRSVAERFARPARVRLVGPPNAGKSTLFNALLGRDRALTAPVPGTTRDTVVAGLELRGVPIRLEDSAGVEDPTVTARGPEPTDGGPPADLLLRLDRRVVRDLAEPHVLDILGFADQGVPAGWPGPAVSGRTGLGVPELLDEVAERLGIPPPGPVDVLVPLEPGIRARIEAASAST